MGGLCDAMLASRAAYINKSTVTRLPHHGLDNHLPIRSVPRLASFYFSERKNEAKKFGRTGTYFAAFQGKHIMYPLSAAYHSKT